MVWPLEPHGVREFASGLQDVLVVEEKRPIIEHQLKDELYHLAASRRPRIFGKYAAQADGSTGGEWSHARPQSDWLLRATADLTPAIVAKAIAGLLKQRQLPADVAARIEARLSVIAASERALAKSAVEGAERLPWFCPGCPHNTSTKVPEGSKAMAGIGCHGMVVWMDRDTTSWTQMGGEGTPWIGQAPFTTRRHMFANLGDGARGASPEAWSCRSRWRNAARSSTQPSGEPAMIVTTAPTTSADLQVEFLEQLWSCLDTLLAGLHPTERTTRRGRLSCMTPAAIPAHLAWFDANVVLKAIARGGDVPAGRAAHDHQSGRARALGSRSHRRARRGAGRTRSA